jgi:hypothetical protein
MCGTIRKALKGKTRPESHMKLYNVAAVPAAIYGSGTWTEGINYEI